MVIPEVQAGEHELLVYVDNSFNEESALHVPNDYYTYGGIIRPVALEEISDLYIENVMFTPYKQGGVWQGSWKVLIRNLGSLVKKGSLRGSLAEVEGALGSFEVKPGSGSNE